MRGLQQDGRGHRRQTAQLGLALLALAVEVLLALLLLRREDVLEQRAAGGRHVDDLRDPHAAYGSDLKGNVTLPQGTGCAERAQAVVEGEELRGEHRQREVDSAEELHLEPVDLPHAQLVETGVELGLVANLVEVLLCQHHSME